MVKAAEMRQDILEISKYNAIPFLKLSKQYALGNFEHED